MTRLHASQHSDPLRAPTALPRGYTLPGGYQIEHQLGAGGFGAVYAGRDTKLDRPVAIKVLTRTLEEQVMRRFRDEGRLLAKLQHPHIIQVYALGELDDQRAYLVMERFGSGSLSDHWTRGQIPPLSLALSIIRQVLEALRAAHDSGVIHRDIKEPNILFDPESGHIKLCDFGIARSSTPLMNQAETTEEGVIIGSLPYLAPERLQGSRGDERSDLYSVGVLMYRLLTGWRPFEEGPHERLSPHVQITKTLTEPPTLPDGLPPRWGRLCLWLLEKEPQRRPESAARALELLHDSLALPLTESASLQLPSELLPAQQVTRTRWPAWRVWASLGALLLLTYYFWGWTDAHPPQRRVLQLGPKLQAPTSELTSELTSSPSALSPEPEWPQTSLEQTASPLPGAEVKGASRPTQRRAPLPQKLRAKPQRSRARTTPVRPDPPESPFVFPN